MDGKEGEDGRSQREKEIERKANKIELEGGEGQERGGGRIYRRAGREGGKEGEDGRR